MKRYLYAAVALLLVAGCKKNTVESPKSAIAIDNFIATKYRGDAGQLLERLYLNGLLRAGATEIALNAEQLQIIEGRLSDIYRLHSTVTDSIFNTMKLHTYFSIDLKSIELEIDSSSAAGKKVVDYLPSGVAGFDKLINECEFTYPSPADGPNYGFVTITSAKSWNIAGLVKSFATYPFVKDASDNEFTGDGNDITYQLKGGGAVITFMQKSGDCLDGCEFVKSWRFNVDASGTATFLGN